MPPKVSAVVVAHEKMWRKEGGGVQVCHREYLAGLAAAGFTCTKVSYEFDRKFIERLDGRLRPRVTLVRAPATLVKDVEKAVREVGSSTIFFGLNMYPDVSRRLRQSFPLVQQVLLSHGAESLDFCIEQRIRRRTGAENHRTDVAERMLGRELMDEAELRQCVDAVFTLSPFEVEIEKWLGAPKSIWIPRMIIETALETHPIDGRVGCVSTLDHPPNFDSLMLFFDALAGITRSGLRFRLVGQPIKLGKALASRYPFIEYLGPLSDAELRSEASTWCCFVHPMFVYAKGCSTKLGVALGWGLPIATTQFGVRGYIWDEDIAPVAATPFELANLVVERSWADKFEENSCATKSICSISPTIEGIGNRMRAFLRH